MANLKCPFCTFTALDVDALADHLALAHKEEIDDDETYIDSGCGCG